MPLQRKPRTFVPALAALAALALAVPAAYGSDSHYEGISEDGGVAVFSTVDKLVPGDTDIQRDVYVRDFEEGFGFVTREASLGPTGGNDAYAAQFLAIDPAGDGVFFSTRERLTAADKDTAIDVYLRDLGLNKTTLVSAGSASCAASGCGNGDFGAEAAANGIVGEGNDIFFVSSEKLATQDGDESPDVYLRDLKGGTTTLVSAAGSPCSGGCGSGKNPAVFQGASADGSKAIFTTAEALTNGDGDAEPDLYERDLESGGETKLVSVPGTGPEPCPGVKKCGPVNSAVSRDGSHVFFETNERISSPDADAFQDVYDWSGGTPEPASLGPLAGTGADAIYEGSSADGTKVFFASDEKLTASDKDASQDVYARTGGASTELVSEGEGSCGECGNGTDPASLEWVSEDGATAILSTAEALTPADGDTRPDVYARALPGGPTTLVSLPGPTCTDPTCGDGEHDARFAGASVDGSHLFFSTDEALAPPAAGDSSGPGDRDERKDVYDRSGGTTSLVSAGQLTGSGPYTGNGSVNAFLQGASADGSRVFLLTAEQLTSEDSDSFDDVYVRSGGGTQLVSRGNDAELEKELAPPDPVLLGTDPESPDAATSIRVLGLEPVEEATIKLYSSANCTGEPVATGSAVQLEDPGIAVLVDLDSVTTFRAIAEAEGFVSPCSGEATYRQRSEESSGGGGGGLVQKPQAKAPPAPGPLVLIPHQVPQTRITFGPAFKTRIRRPVFRFTDATGQQDTKFVCKLDRLGWKPCSSPLKLPKVSRGKHLLRVKGINALGVWETKPTKRAFKLVAAK
jgi:hypothetical protein